MRDFLMEEFERFQLAGLAHSLDEQTFVGIAGNQRRGVSVGPQAEMHQIEHRRRKRPGEADAEGVEVVPVLAGPARSDPEQVRRTSAALLTWAALLLVPVSLVVVAIAQPLVSVLLGGTPGFPRADMVTLGARPVL